MWVVRPAVGGAESPAARWCATCCAPVLMVAPEVAAAIAGVGPRAIYRSIEDARLHFTEAPGGMLLICLNSLTA